MYRPYTTSCLQSCPWRTYYPSRRKTHWYLSSQGPRSLKYTISLVFGHRTLCLRWLDQDNPHCHEPTAVQITGDLERHDIDNCTLFGPRSSEKVSKRKWLVLSSTLIVFVNRPNGQWIQNRRRRIIPPILYQITDTGRILYTVWKSSRE